MIADIDAYAETALATTPDKHKPIPDYSAIQTIIIFIRLVGLVLVVGSVALLVYVSLVSGEKFTHAYVQICIACVAGIIGGFLYIALGEFMAAFRDIARNVAEIANRP